MSRCTAQVDEYIVMTETYIEINDIMLISLPSSMNPPAKAIIIAIEKPPQTEELR